MRSRARSKRPATSWLVNVNAPQKIAGFIAVLVVVFAAAFGIGAAIGPEAGDATTDHSPTHAAESVTGVQNAAATELPAGLSSTENEYTRSESGDGDGH